MDKHSRRDFIVRSTSLIAVGLAAPAWLSHLARAEVARRASGVAADGQQVLVVCQLSGGNDGLNTVIPYSQAAYYKLRPTLAVPEGSQLPISDSLALHPSMPELQQLFKAGELAIVNGVGYPNPNRSHFAAMSIWQTADPAGQQTTGWLGRYLDWQATQGSNNPVLALSLGSGRIEALQGQAASVPTFASLEDIQGMVGDPDAERALRAIQGSPAGAGGLAHVKASTDTALNAMDALAARLDTYAPTGNYGGDSFGQGFKQIAHLIAISPTTKVIYFAVGGFDTHAGQEERQKELLAQFSTATSSFMDEMKRLGRADAVSLLVFSEFGRRVEENGSQGTDHGAAAPVFVLGGGVRGGLYGSYPSLDNLDNGDLRFGTDFRQVYATLLQDWLGGDSASLLGAEYQTLPLFG